VEGVKKFAIAITLSIGAVLVARAQLIGDCPKPPVRKPIVVQQVRGVIVDSALARIPTIEIRLQSEMNGSFHDIRMSKSDSSGRFDFGVLPAGTYRLVTAGHGNYAAFCSQALAIKVANPGWLAFRIKLPVHASDSCPGQCDAKVEELKASFERARLQAVP
jgi:hypothetical protein